MWRQSGSYYQKCNLLEQHTNHLYIYIKENQYVYTHWISLLPKGYASEKEILISTVRVHQLCW